MKSSVVLALAVFAAMLVLAAMPAVAGPLPGAIFTTTETGNRVNANIYPAKEDVYLDGGPGPNAPISAAGLPEGDYFFQVTDPSGKVLLSEDPVKCRCFHVNDKGIISSVLTATALKKIKGQVTESTCTHKTGTDIDHNALTVQLMPYDNTPNNGGVYKVWVTPVEHFAGDDITKVDSPSWPGFHGFLPSWSKTDNYKVKGKTIPPVICIRKFDDSDGDGIWDECEKEITGGSIGECVNGGWPVSVEDPISCVNDWYTAVCVNAVPVGEWKVTEGDAPRGCDKKWKQTASYLDGVPICPPQKTVCVNVAGTSTETHEIIFGNVQLGECRAKKFYDRNGNGKWDSGECAIAGWKIRLQGNGVDITKCTDANGEILLADDLLPGEYTICEIIPTNSCCEWKASTDTCVQLTLTEGGCITACFGNYCTDTVAFGTKGYWHNKNGLSEMTQDDINYVNGLTCAGKPGPYQAPSSYFADGDEPFNGKFQDGTNVAEVKGEWNDTIAPEGSAKAEVSAFLVDSNSGGDPREQLAQQLLAFIFNCRERLGGVGATILSPGGPVDTSELVCQAVSIWNGTDGSKQTSIAGILDGYNNCSSVTGIRANPCGPITY